MWNVTDSSKYKINQFIHTKKYISNQLRKSAAVIPTRYTIRLGDVLQNIKYIFLLNL